MTASSSLPPGAASAAPAPAPPGRPAYPPTRAVPVKYTLHGVEITDPYRWLEDGDSPEVKEWMKSQDAFTRAELSRLPERDAIASRLKQLFYIDAVSAPRHRRGRYFLSRRHATKEKSIIYWKEGKGGEERALLDPNRWSDDGSVSLGGWEVSWDGKNVAYKVQKNNSDEATLYVMDVASGKRSEVDVIEGGKYAYASWTPSGDGFYYVWLPTDPSIPVADRPGYAEVRFHRLGQDPKQDRVVRGKTGDPKTFLNVSLSKDGRFLVLTVSHGWTSTDVYFRDLRKPGGQAQAVDKPLAVGRDAHYNVEVHKDRFYVHTDEGAPHYRLFEVDPGRPERAAWKEIVPERPDATLDSVSVVGGHLALSYLEDASSRVEVRSLDGKLVREVPLPGIGTVGGPSGLPDEDEAYFSFESFTSPQAIYATSIKTGETALYARIDVPVDPSPFTVEQTFFPSRDGTKISMFIVRRKDMKKDGSSRALLYGYGGFQISQTPSFTASMYPWLERGGVYAVANLRGGGEYGEAWHRDGMLLKKQNVFDDFIAAAEHLVREGYTQPERLVIQGGSNGGLLVGAALTQRPELFGAVVCGVPLLDMVRYHLFGSGKTWISEYGSADDPEQFNALHAYSPYHRVRPGTRYPAVLLLSADSDDRVDPMHARKFAAALQAASAGGPVLLRIERNAGHGGADLIKAAVEKGADQISFALSATSAKAHAIR
ncbi:prolyl oligopeptidase family serine peptidase [Sorangium cellulosum]|uniref:prolyl oligopeptidase family serine peptidase n=1 Tax=Sorangium TaxID=39643 RepID=UPI0009D6571D